MRWSAYSRIHATQRETRSANRGTIATLFDIVNSAANVVRRRKARCNVYPAFTERRAAFAARNATKAFIVKCLMQLYAA
jgi:hypothetical protein